MTEETKNRIRKMVSDRDWKKFHTPSNLAKSISIEANELLECFQWDDKNFDLQHVKEELADVMIYCQDMLDALSLDEDEIINMKMDMNEAKNLDLRRYFFGNGIYHCILNFRALFFQN